VSVGWDGRPAAKLATAWHVSHGGRQVRLDLHPGVRFHDGSELTAEIARNALTERLRDKNTIRSAISYPSVEKIEVDGAHRLIVHLKRPESFFLSDLSLTSLAHPERPTLGTGPFKRVAEPPASSDYIKLVAFESYYRGKPGVEQVEFRRYEEQRTAWAALLRDEIDAVHEITPGSIDFAQQDDRIATFQFVRPYYMLLGFNVRHPLLGKKEVRQALSQAVNRQELIKVALNGQGVIAQGPIWPSHWAYSATPQTYGHNPEAAILRLEAAGVKMSTGKQSGQMPTRLRFTCLTIPDARYEKLAVILQKQLYEVGIDMEIEVMPLSALVARIESGSFDAFLAERTSGRSLSWTYTTFHSKYRMIPGYTAADIVLEHLRSAANENETRAAVVELQRVFHEDPPAVFLVWPKIARAVSTKFSVPWEANRDVIGSLWQWRAAATTTRP
jgi:peptide/nickel transport system substrate-binding protein